MDDDVLGPDRRETIAAMFADAFRKTRRIGREFQVGAIDIDQRRQRREPDETADLRDDRLMPLNIGVEHCGQFGRHVGLEFEQNHPPAPAAADRGAEQPHQILGLFLDFDVAVADDAEHADRAARIARENQVGEQFDQIFDRHEARRLARYRHQSRQRSGDHHQFANRVARRLALEIEDHAKAAVGDEGKGVRGIKHLRRQDREYLFAEILTQRGTQPLALRPGAVNDDPLFGEQTVQLLPLALLFVDEPVHLGLDLGELLPRRAAVGRRIVDPLKLLPLQAGDADHEEFVEIAPRNRQEAQPLEQGMRRIARLLHHPPVEGEPRQFAVEKAVGVRLVEARNHRIIIGAKGLTGYRHGPVSCLSSKSGSMSPCDSNVSRVRRMLMARPFSSDAASSAATTRWIIA